MLHISTVSESRFDNHLTSQYVSSSALVRGSLSPGSSFSEVAILISALSSTCPVSGSISRSSASCGVLLFAAEVRTNPASWSASPPSLPLMSSDWPLPWSSTDDCWSSGGEGSLRELLDRLNSLLKNDRLGAPPVGLGSRSASWFVAMPIPVAAGAMGCALSVICVSSLLRARRSFSCEHLGWTAHTKKTWNSSSFFFTRFNVMVIRNVKVGWNRLNEKLKKKI